MNHKKPFTLVKMLDEGASSPFVARLFMTPLMLRDLVVRDKRRAEFDQVYQFIINHLIDLRTSTRDLSKLWNEYSIRVASGEAAYYDNAVHVRESIVQPLNKHVKMLIMDAARLAKKVQNLTKILGIDISFIFQKKPAYEKQLGVLNVADPQLATYLGKSRKWLEPLRMMRDEFEHGTFSPPPLQYEPLSDGGLLVVEPSMQGLPLTKFFPTLLSRLSRFVEEVLTWCIQRNLPEPLIVVEIPLADRNPKKRERFNVSIMGHGDPWAICYSDDSFDDV